MNDFPHNHPGGCECGAVRFDYRCREPLAQQVARACQCEFCLPREASYLSDSVSELEVRIRDRRYLYAHRFGTATAEFMHCAVCNTEVYVACDIDGTRYALVRAAALDEFTALGGTSEVSHDDESLEQRLSRRARNWIPVLKSVVTPT
jgi:hypothetical protein